MPIGAAIGGAVIAAGGAVASGAMSSHAQTKAADTAAATASATADKNNALYASIYGQNKDLLTPTVNQGQQAGNALNDLLLGTHSYNANPAPAASSGALSSYGGNPADAYLAANPDVAAEARRVTADHEFATPEAYAQWHFNQYGKNEGRTFGATAPATTPAATSAATGAPSSALSAFDQFKQGTNYQWRFNQGMSALGSQYAAKGALDSGAAQKAAITFGQNTASGELSNYMNLLAQQQGFGLSAASAVAGVGNTYATNVAGQNTNASNVTANAALTSGQANANMWGTVGNATGQLGGALYQSGMGQMQQPKVPTAQSLNFTPPQGSQNYFSQSTGF